MVAQVSGGHQRFVEDDGHAVLVGDLGAASVRCAALAVDVQGPVREVVGDRTEVHVLFAGLGE